MTWQMRALKIALDRDNTHKVTKPHFVKFFRAWKESGTTMQAYIQKLADEAPPTLFQEGVDLAGKAAEKAAAAKDAVAEKAAAAKEGVKNLGKGLFGGKGKSPDKKAAEE